MRRLVLPGNVAGTAEVASFLAREVAAEYGSASQEQQSRRRAFADECYFRGRDAAVAYLEDRLRRHLRCQHRVLIGFDFAYGYPSGLARALGLPVDRHAWWTVWTELCHRVTDGPENQSNRFQAATGLNRILGNDKGGGPFWGVPAKQATSILHAGSPGFPFVADGGVELERLRLTRGSTASDPSTRQAPSRRPISSCVRQGPGSPTIPC